MTTTATYMLYMIFTLGGAGLYFLLPRTERAKPLVGAVMGIAALGAWLVVLATQSLSPETGFFYLFATIAIVAAARVITHKKPVYSAIYFVLVVVAVAALMLLLEAEFVAVALIIIYAGAILVTYLFVIMLARQRGDAIYDQRSREPLMAVFAGFVLMAAVATHAGDVPAAKPAPAATVALNETAPVDAPPLGNTAALGELLMTRYVVALELSGLLLLISMIGAIALSKKRVPAEGPPVERRPLGEIGKEVDPF